MRFCPIFSSFLLAAATFTASCTDTTPPSPAPIVDATAPLPAGTTADWHLQRTIYHVAVRSYQDSDGDGLGDLAGLASRLPYIAALRAGTVLLDPIGPTSFLDGPRALSDFTTVAPELGDLDDVAALVAAAQADDLKLILTLPINHTDRFHPWFTAAREATASEAGQRYRWTTAPVECKDVPVASPNIYGDSRWSPGATTDVFYYHRFAASSPDLNLSDEATVADLENAIAAWLDRGFDGIYFPNSFAWHEERDGDGEDCEHTSTSRTLLERLRAIFDARPGKVMLTADQHPTDTLQANRLRTSAYVSGGNRAHLVLDADATTFLQAQHRTGFPVENFNAHLSDLATRTAADGAGAIMAGSLYERPRASASLGNTQRLFRLLLSVQMASPFTPMLFYGDELGLGSGTSKIGDDPRFFHVPPMAWTATAPTYGFSDGTPYLEPPLGADLANVQLQILDEGSLYTFARRLIDLRNAHAALRAGSFIVAPVADRATGSPLPDAFAWIRRSDTDTVVAIHNLSDEAREGLVNMGETGWPAGQALVDLLRPTSTLSTYGGEAADYRISLEPQTSRYLVAVSDVGQ